MVRQVLLLATVVVLAAAVGDAEAQQSRCADCHFANPDAPGSRHLADWDSSAHGRANVGCDRCHGGNPSTFERLQAHVGILMGRNPASPVHRTALPATCGRCHAGPFVAFQKSRHYELLRAGSGRGPTCSTCHGEVAANLLSPKGIERECNECHGPGETAPRAGRAADARALLEAVRDLRAQLSAAQRLINSVTDTARKQELQAAYRQAEVPLIETANYLHEFVLTNSRERLETARQRTTALYASLVAPAR